ncbi:MAG TPA: HD domain-containing protein [archaeon]|nr:HD domain-containing protein [archaeon]
MDEKSLIEFAKICGKLKRTLRTGWVNRKVRNPESVAEHSWRAAVLCLVLADKNLDKNKLVKMAVVHDLEEALTGDIITKEKEANAEVSKRNAAEAMKKISAVIGGAEGKEIFELWEDYENTESEEAKFLSDVEKLEMLIQAYEYGKVQPDRKEILGDFFSRTASKIKNPKIIKILDALLKMKNIS